MQRLPRFARPAVPFLRRCTALPSSHPSLPRAALTLSTLTLSLRTSVRHYTAASTPSATGASTSSSTANSSLYAMDMADAAQLRAARDGPFTARLRELRAELEQMEKTKQLCDAAAQRHPEKRMKQLFAFLILQAAVLFDWTYIHFDWNLVEPITYLIGYSATWIAILWYGALQREFSFDSLREWLHERQREKLYSQHQLDIARYEAVKVEVAKMERVLRSLEVL